MPEHKNHTERQAASRQTAPYREKPLTAGKQKTSFVRGGGAKKAEKKPTVSGPL